MLMYDHRKDNNSSLFRDQYPVVGHFHFPLSNDHVSFNSSGGSKISEKRGGGDNLSVPILIYRKCIQRSICLLHGKRRVLKKNSEPIGEGAAAPTAPLNPPLSNTVTTSTVQHNSRSLLREFKAKIINDRSMYRTISAKIIQHQTPMPSTFNAA